MNSSSQEYTNTDQLFGLTDESAEYRERWRSVVLLAIWLILSGITMILNTYLAQENYQILVIIAMSFIAYIPLLKTIYGQSLRMASLHLNYVYGLNNVDLAVIMLNEILFGSGHEKITVDKGVISQKNRDAAILIVGGPGEIQINLDSAALLEKADGEPRVIYPRAEPWRLDRFERIHEINSHNESNEHQYATISLADQTISGLSLKSRTKDGISIEIQGIKVIFSILRKERMKEDKILGKTYPFNKNAIQDIVYNQTIITPKPSTPPGSNFILHTTLIPLITSELEEIIKSQTLKDLLPVINQQDTKIFFGLKSRFTSHFFEKNFRQKATSLGISIEWIDIGIWQLSSSLIFDKHKEELDKISQNAKRNESFELLSETKEIIEITNLINNVVISNFERANPGSSSSSWDYEKDISNKKILKQIEAIISKRPELKEQFFLDEGSDEEMGDRLASFRSEIRNQITQQETSKKDAANTAREILKAFRKELINGKALIEKENRPQAEKLIDLNKINKVLYDIENLTFYYLN